MLISVDAAQVRKEYGDSNAKLSNIQSRISSLSVKLKQDFGKYVIELPACTFLYEFINEVVTDFSFYCDPLQDHKRNFIYIMIVVSRPNRTSNL